MNTEASHFIAGGWLTGAGPPMVSTSPVDGAETWQGRSATVDEVGRAVSAARLASTNWACSSHSVRAALVQAVAEQYKARRVRLAEAISRETGKPRWEANFEVDVMIAKTAVSLDAHERRTGPSNSTSAGVTTATRFKPHGVVAVLGPFNMPGHLPNGHLIPAILAGNSAVFKPSEQTPLVGAEIAQAWQAAGVPAGVFNLLQGGAPTGAALVNHAGLDGIFFTGSAAVGLMLSRALAERPGTILALEMGGNNPLVVYECGDLSAAALLTVQSAYVTSGQRCSCARRLIVPRGAEGDAFLAKLVELIGHTRVGLPTDEPEPYVGTVISAAAAARLLDAQATLLAQGGQCVVEMRRSPRSAALLTPGLIDVTSVRERQDEELFGPLLQLIRVSDFDAAIREANNTRYGLAAGLISDRRELYDRFYRDVRAGVINWNRPLTGSSSALPFGGVGHSGNHRPSASFAADYCAYPVASTETERATLPAQLPMGISP